MQSTCNKIGKYHICFQEKRDQAVNDVLKTTDLTGREIQDIRTNIPPVPLRDVAKPADSDDEEAKQDFLLKRKIHLEKGRRIARRNQIQGRRLLDFVTSMEPVEDVSVKQLLEIASENVPPRNKSSNVSLTPLQSSSATNAEEALRLNERRSRLTLHKKARLRPCQSAVGHDQTTQSESFGVTAGAIRTSVTLNDIHIPDPLEFSEEDCMSVLSDLYFNN